jgi:hypothetical protein
MPDLDHASEGHETYTCIRHGWDNPQFARPQG